MLVVSSTLDEHRGYLADRHRLRAFEMAISEVVRPGATVLDLASGTGILGLLACRAGAAHVYSVDRGPIVGVARVLARANGFDDRILSIRALSLQTTVPSPIDVIVGDLLGPFAVEAGLIEYFSDARDRFLEPGGRIVPAVVELCVAPVRCSDVRDRIAFWDTMPAGFDFAAMKAAAVNARYPIDLSPDQLLGDPVTLMSLDMASVTPGLIRASAGVRIRKSGELDGIGGWFCAKLSPGAAMSNSPLAPDRIDRKNIFFPVEQRLAVVEGDEVNISMRILPSASVFTWKVEVRRADSIAPHASFTHSTWRGMLMSDEDLDRTSSTFAPSPNAHGAACATALALFDGQHRIEDIERELLGRHPGLFRSAHEAAAFLAELSGRYAK